jgi:hypothetical protein
VPAHQGPIFHGQPAAVERLVRVLAGLAEGGHAGHRTGLCG